MFLKYASKLSAIKSNKMVNCTHCLTPISRNKKGIQCEGCKNYYHGSCVSKNYDLPKLLNDITTYSWKCPLPVFDSFGGQNTSG